MASHDISEGAPRAASIIVVIDDDIGKGKFRLLSDPNAGGVPVIQNYVVQFDNNQGSKFSKGFLVSFNLPDDQGKNASWVFDDPPIFVKIVDEHGACPKAGDHNATILTNPTVTQGGRRLTVTNSNSSKQYFGFALRFKHTETENRKLLYDPIGDNQNGNERVVSWSLLTYAGVAIGAGIVSALVTSGALWALHLNW